MTPPSFLRALRRARCWRRRGEHTRDERGFILLESLIAISVITVVMSAVGAEFVNGTISASRQRATQVAVQVADSTVEQIRSLDASDLVTGRDTSSVTAQLGAAGPQVTPWLAKMDKAVDAGAATNSGPTAALPTVGVPQTVGSVVYTVNQYLGQCSIPTTGPTDCVAPATLGGASAVAYLRAVVAVTWTGQRCGTTPCAYVTSTLVSGVADPTFRARAAAYPSPVVTMVADRASVVGDTAGLQMATNPGTGVAPLSWAVASGSLPVGLSLNSSTGLISGTVGDSVGTYTPRIQVTDAFLRTDVEDLTWRVVRPPTYTNPGTLVTATADPVNRQIQGATGGEPPYVFSDPTSSLPPGLAVSAAGLISGSPTTQGSYTVRIRLTDAGGRTYTDPFTWTVTFPTLAVTNPGPQTSSVSTALSPPLQLNASGGSGPYFWSDATPRTLPAGLVLNTGTGLITGTPTVLGSSTVTLTVTSGSSSRSVTFSWTVGDGTPPTNALTLSGVTGGAYKSGSIVYYRGAAAGSFALTNTVTDANSGPASSQTAALGGTTTGWTHTPSTVSTPAGGPYASNPFAWTAGTAGAPTETVTGRDVAANTAATALTFRNDSTNPSSGSISYPDGFTSGRSVTVTFTAGTDGDSGIDPSQGRLKRSSAPLVNGVCGTYTTINVFALAPTSPYVDTSVRPGACYTYQYGDTDHVGNRQFYSSTSVAKVDYAGAVRTDPSLLSYWRLGEPAAGLLSADSFTSGAAATLLSARAGETSATWAPLGSNNATVETFTPDQNFGGNSFFQGIRHSNGAGTGTYYASATPTSANYRVEADLTVKTLQTGDAVGVVGRLSTNGTFYGAQYNVPTGAWQLYKSVNGTITLIGTPSAETLTPTGSTSSNGQRHLALDLNGTTIRLLVDGVVKVTATDSSITAAGRGGVRFVATSTSSTTTGLHLDNFAMTPAGYPRAVDTTGTNTGDYFNGPALGVPGALANDDDTAARFDGVSDYVRVPAPIGLPVGAGTRSVEMWVKTSSSARQVLYTYGTRWTSGGEFGLWLQNSTITAWGIQTDYDKTFTASAPLNDGSWHQIVSSYNGTAMTVYVDGVSLGTQSVTRATSIDQYGFTIGGVLAPGDINSGGWFNGSLDEASFYTRALTQNDVTNHYQLATSAAQDFTGPTDGSVDAVGLTGSGGRYSTSVTLSLALDPGTDPSGLATTGNQLLRSAGTLSGGTCTAFGAYSQVGADDPSTPRSDTVADGACYRYDYVVSDSLGNSSTYTSGDIKVDTVPPTAPTLGFTGFTNTSVTGSTLYYRPGAASGAFAVTADSSDPSSGISSYAFPGLGTGWTSTAGALGTTTYSWAAANPAVPGSPVVTATNSAGRSSAGTALTVTPDSTAPATGTVTYPDRFSTSTSVSVGFTTGSDSGSGVGTRLLQRASAPLSGSTGSCGTFTAFSTVTGGTNPTSPFVETVPTGSCYKYQYVTTDNVGNTGTPATSTSVVKVGPPYAPTIAGTAGLLNWFRLGEATLSSDSFTDASQTPLTGHTGELGATWSFYQGADLAKISSANRLYRSGSGFSAYYTNATPPSSDYSVEADLVFRSNINNDFAGVVGRVDTAGVNAYGARWEQGTNGGNWVLFEYDNGNLVTLRSVAATARTANQVNRIKLEMIGSLIKLYVDGVQITSVTDTTISGAGRAGFFDGNPSAAITKTDTTGIQYDNFSVTPVPAPRVTDSKGSSVGDYFLGVVLGAAGAIAGDANTAVTYDGVNDYSSVPRTIQDDFAVEFWFKSTQGIGTGTQWGQGAGLVDASGAGTANDFGVSLRSDGKVVAGVGSPDVSIVSSAGGYNNGAWHYVVFNRVKGTGAMQLFVDGVSAGTATSNTATLTGSTTINVARLATGGNYLAGSLDEMALYNTVLSQATVTSHYNAGQGG